MAAVYVICTEQFLPGCVNNAYLLISLLHVGFHRCIDILLDKRLVYRWMILYLVRVIHLILEFKVVGTNECRFFCLRYMITLDLAGNRK